MPKNQRPALCGTPECDCDRATLGGFGRWDHVAETRATMDRGWCGASDIGAPLYADVLALERALLEARGELRAKLITFAEANPNIKDPEAYAAKHIHG